MSVPITREKRPSLASDRAIAPEPVPTSTALVDVQREVSERRLPHRVLEGSACGSPRGCSQCARPVRGGDGATSLDRHPVPRHVVEGGEKLACLAVRIRAVAPEHRRHRVGQLAQGMHPAGRLDW
jgi:hypothetical protein